MTFQSRDKALRGAVRSPRWWSRVRRVITSNPKIKVTHQCVSFLSIWIGDIINIFVWDVTANDFYNVVVTLFLGVTYDYVWSINIR